MLWRYRCEVKNREISRLRTPKSEKLGPGASLVHVRTTLGTRGGFSRFWAPPKKNDLGCGNAHCIRLKSVRYRNRDTPGASQPFGAFGCARQCGLHRGGVTPGT